MEKSKEEIEKWLKEQNLPYVKKLTNGFYEVFDGVSKYWLSENAYKQFNNLMREEGLKGLNKKP